MTSLKHSIRASAAAMAVIITAVATPASADVNSAGSQSFGFVMSPLGFPISAGISALPGFGLNSAQHGSGFGLTGCPGFICNPMFGLNAQQNIGFPGSNFGPFSWGLSGAQNIGIGGDPFALGISTPWGGMFAPGFGVTPAGWPRGNPPPFFGLGGQQGPQPQYVPVMVPYPVPMQGPIQGPAQGAPQGGAQPVQCMINAVPALTKSVDDCEKAGGSAPQKS